MISPLVGERIISIIYCSLSFKKSDANAFSVYRMMNEERATGSSESKCLSRWVFMCLLNFMLICQLDYDSNRVKLILSMMIHQSESISSKSWWTHSIVKKKGDMRNIKILKKTSGNIWSPLVRWWWYFGS